MATHITLVVPRFGELDPYNHVNHAVYVSYFEASRCVALESIGMSLPDLTDQDVLIIVTQLEMQFKAPATARDVLRIETEVVEIKRASTRWAQRVVRESTSGSGGSDGSNGSGGAAGELVLVTGLITAAICNNQGKPRRPPPDLMEALKQLTPDTSSVNPAEAASSKSGSGKPRSNKSGSSKARAK